MQKSTASLALVLAFSLAVVQPATALGCNINFRTIGPVRLDMSRVKRPVERPVDRSSWQLADTWVGTRPELNQLVRVRGLDRPIEAVSFAGQQALSIDAAAPADNGWRFRDDDLESTAPCALVGKAAWQTPRILVREGRREVRIAAVARPTEGDRTGCVLGGEGAAWSCPTLVRVLVRLKRPLGSRTLVFEHVR